ncbi:replication protein RepA [Alphaproteobacteria bacterium]|nr:replication protein RepA [Alphaproteobacteria bacterium]
MSKFVFEPENMKLSRAQEKLREASVAISQEDPKEIGFVCRSMVAASMPHSNTKGIVFNRKSKNITLSIVGNERAGGLPYGTYPRLILSWLASEVVKKKEREIVLGSSLSSFMKKIGLSVTGGRWGTVPRFKDQMQRLFSSVITVGVMDKKSGEFAHTNLSIAEKSQIFWNPSHPEQIDLFKSKIFIGEMFFKETMNAPIPIDIRALNVLKSSSLALDIYFWLTYRMSYIIGRVEIPFDNLHTQFGAGYPITSHGRYEFKRKFLIQLEKVLFLYPQAKVEIKETHICLKSSPTHVPRNLLNI